jgi:hypothetical protein
MAAWRQAIELAIGEEDFGGFGRDCSLADGTGEAGRAGADAAGLPGRPVVFKEDGPWGCIIRLPSAVLNERWPLCAADHRAPPSDQFRTLQDSR